MTRLLESKSAVRAERSRWRGARHTVAFVPTMGALHEGHLSLVRAAAARADRVIASVFVNPLQFAPDEDLQKYPRDLGRDLALLETAGCDALFTTTPEQMYPPGFATYVVNDAVAHRLEGEFRPTHFRGVLTVVLKLFQIVAPDVAVFGQKDAQQAFLIQRMVSDLDVPLEVVVSPIIREPDGLAMSSRNAFLSADERERAIALSRGIEAARQLLRGGRRDARGLEAAAQTVLQQADADVDYVTIVDPATFEPMPVVDSPGRLLVAARVGSTRLIDNDLLTPE